MAVIHFGHVEDGVRVSETHYFYHGHEITNTERLGLSTHGKTLSYMAEIRGPGKGHTIELDFDLS